MKSFVRLAALPLALAFLLPAAAPAQGYAVSVFINGQRMQFDQPPVVQGGRVFVPMRAVFQQLGASVVYNNGQINATGGGRTISLTIGSTTAYIDGKVQYLDVAPFTVGDRTLVPLRFVATSLGANVNWDASQNSVTITKGYNPPPRPPAPPPPPQNIVFTQKSPTQTVYTSQPLIGFALSRPSRPNLIQVTVDGNLVAPGSVNQFSDTAFNFRVPPLYQGRHTVRVWGRTSGGKLFDLSWSFNTGVPR